MHANAVEPRIGTSNLGSYDLYVPARQDQRVGDRRAQVSCAKRSSTRASAGRGLDREELARVLTVPRVQSVTVGAGGDRDTVFGLNIVVPLRVHGAC